MFWLNDSGELTVGECPGEGYILVNPPKFSSYKLKSNWKECLPDVWEFSSYKISLELFRIVDQILDEELEKAYRSYIKDLFKFKTKAGLLIESISSDEDVQSVIEEIEKMRSAFSG
jgi:hypothetical protein